MSLKFLKLFEQFNDIDSKIDYYLKIDTFDNLPIDFKKGFLTWCFGPYKTRVFF